MPPKYKLIEDVDFFDMFEFEHEINQSLKYNAGDAITSVIADEKMTRKILNHFTHYVWDVIEYDTFDYGDLYYICFTKDKSLFCNKLFTDDGNMTVHPFEENVFVHADCKAKILEELDAYVNNLFIFDVQDVQFYNED